jgi:hypothetical protein
MGISDDISVRVLQQRDAVTHSLTLTPRAPSQNLTVERAVARRQRLKKMGAPAALRRSFVRRYARTSSTLHSRQQINSKELPHTLFSRPLDLLRCLRPYDPGH